LRRAAAHQPVTENVLLADHGEIVRFEAGFEAEHCERNLEAGPTQYVRVGGDVRQVDQSMVCEHMAHPLAGAVAPHRNHDVLAILLQRVDMLGDCVEDIRFGFGALGCEVAAGSRSGIHDCGVRIGEWREARDGSLFQKRLPAVFVEIELVGR